MTSLRATPLHISDPGGSPTETGEVVKAAKILMGIELKPAQLQLIDVVTAHTNYTPNHDTIAIQIPRRCGKTTALLAIGLTRCLTRKNYHAIYTAQTGLKSQQRFREFVKHLQQSGKKGWVAKQAAGATRVEFPITGSVFRFVTPVPESFRGDEGDLIILDEGQEIGAEESQKLLGAVLPLMDTRPAGQIIVAGTTGEVRSGLLWDALELGRTGEWGILEYAADPHKQDVTSEDTWLSVHPGIGTLTTIEKIRQRFKQLSLVEFCREYLGVWPEATTTSAFSQEVWEAAGSEHEELPLPGEKVGIAFDLSPDRKSAAAALAWRNAEGTARISVICGTESVVTDTVLKVSRKYNMPIGYDSVGGGVLDVADKLARAKPHPKLIGLGTQQYISACAGFVSAVLAGELKHARQEPLNEAVEVAGKRLIGDAGWGWARKKSNGSIAPLVAATVALKIYDDLPARSRPRIVA